MGDDHCRCERREKRDDQMPGLVEHGGKERKVSKDEGKMHTFHPVRGWLGGTPQQKDDVALCCHIWPALCVCATHQLIYPVFFVV